MKKAQTQMMWIIIGAVLAILILVIYSFLTGGIVKRFTETVFRVQEDSEQRAACTVPAWEQGDTDGDGIRDDDAECRQLAGKS